MVMRSALEPAVFLERYPRASIDVYIEVLEADGGTRCASINAAAVALVDAGIPMKDLVAACAVGKIEDKLVVDLGDYEDKKGQSDMPIAYMPKLVSHPPAGRNTDTRRSREGPSPRNRGMQKDLRDPA
jgi:exosome complex component RRP41